MNENNFSAVGPGNPFAWHESSDQVGCSYRDGWGIIIPDARTGGQKAFGDMVFPTMDAANTTAARIAPGARDILPVREIWHRSKFQNSLRRQRTIIIKETAVV
jgi:hypothetical protein